ncbi:MAG: hypothetical protein ACWA49_05320 [Ruegeria sp.]
MTQTRLVPIRFENAVWEGHIPGNSCPQVEARFQDQSLPGVDVTQVDGGWSIRIPVPSTLLSDGVHCVSVWDVTTQDKLGDFTIIAGAPASDDMRAQLDLLRAELDMLKRVVRRLNSGQS